MGGVWDISKYLTKPFATLCQVKVIQGYDVKNGQIQSFGFGWYDTCF